MSRRPHVVVVGSTMVDLIAYVDRVPAGGETLEGSGFSLGFGGKGANQAVMAARLGAHVTFVNCVGDDLFGRLTREDLEAAGIADVRVRALRGQATGVAPIWVEDGGANRIVIVPGANHAVTAAVVREELGALGAAPDCVVCQLEIPQEAVAEAFRLGRAAGAATILNPAPAATLRPEVLELADWVIPNESEFEALYGRRFDGRAGRGLVVTLGARGAALGGNVVPTLSVEPVDTTGAGDAFVGGFAYALADGREVGEALELGNACGALSVTRLGTRTSFPDREEAFAAAARLAAAIPSRT